MSAHVRLSTEDLTAADLHQLARILRILGLHATEGRHGWVDIAPDPDTAEHPSPAVLAAVEAIGTAFTLDHRHRAADVARLAGLWRD